MFAPYPAIGQSDPMQQMLAQVLGGYKPGQLGAAPTLGNEEGQQDYARQLAEALAQQQSAESGLGMADRLSQAEYAPNSGALGSIAMLAQAYAGKKLRGKESASQADAMAKAEQARAGIVQQRSESERSRLRVVGRQLGLTNREQAEFEETGKIPEAKRDRLQAIPSAQGLAIVNLDQNSYSLPGQDTGQQKPETPFQIEGDVPPQVRAAMQADPAAWESGNSIDIPEQRQQGGPLMPYVDPSIAQQREASNRRADEAAARADKAAARADKADARAERALQFQQEQVSKKAAAQENQPNAMRQDAINFAAAYTGKSPEEVAKMTPEQVRAAVLAGDRKMTGPIMGRMPGAGATFNADLDAYANSAAGKQARINNPTGPVSNADFEIARKSVFSAEKPAQVNADLIYQALQGGQSAADPQSDGGLTPDEQRELEDLRKRLGR